MKIHDTNASVPARWARGTASIGLVVVSSLALLVPQAQAQQPVPLPDEGRDTCVTAGSLDPACMLEIRHEQMTALWRGGFSQVG